MNNYINPTREEFIDAYCEAKSRFQEEYDSEQIRFRIGEVYDYLLATFEKIPIPIYAEEVIYLDKLWELHNSKSRDELQDYAVELEFAAQKLLKNYGL